MVCEQSISRPPLLVAQMTEEWLNYYRKIAQVTEMKVFLDTGAEGDIVIIINNHYIYYIYTRLRLTCIYIYIFFALATFSSCPCT